MQWSAENNFQQEFHDRVVIKLLTFHYHRPLSFLKPWFLLKTTCEKIDWYEVERDLRN